MSQPAGKPCSPKSKFVNNPLYECGPNGVYRLKKGYKKVNVAGTAAAPKGSLNSYMRWLADGNRARVKAANPGLKANQLASLAGAEWRALSDDQKRPYVEQASQGKAQHAELMKAHEATHGKAQKEIVQVTKASKVGVKGTKGYNLFDKDIRAILKQQNAHLAAWQLSGEISKAWKALPESERQDYNDRAMAKNTPLTFDDDVDDEGEIDDDTVDNTEVEYYY